LEGCYVNIALDIGVNRLFTYRVPPGLHGEVETGKRVLVPFRKKIFTGVVIEIKNGTDFIKTRDIASFLDDKRVLSDEYIEFCNWLSAYYTSPLGEFIFSGIPGKINIKSDVYYSPTDCFTENFNSLSGSNIVIEKIYSFFAKNTKQKYTEKQLVKKLKSGEIRKYLDFLEEKNIIESEKLYSRPLGEKFIKIVNRRFNPYRLNEIFDEKKIKSEKQKHFLSIISSGKNFDLSEIMKKSGITSGSVLSLLNKELIEITDEKVLRQSSGIFSEIKKEIILNSAQTGCVEKISEFIEHSQFRVFMLYGVTGSGKTEVYIRVAANTIAMGKQVIILVPEISLTPQLIFRFRSNFGNIIGVIHSRLSDGERLDTFHGIKEGKYKLVIGARSALFAPLINPGLIIVDEEHDSSYKQENSPRYNARDAAIMRAKINNIPVILGSATPSIESYFNAKKGKYILLELPERATKINMPEISIIDVTNKSPFDKDKIDNDFILDLITKSKVKFLSRELIFKIDDRLRKNENVILLQNRRGFHSYIECVDCGNVETCINCNITLTYHKSFNSLKCHYCGYMKPKIQRCSECMSTRIIEKGAGTEKVEEEIKELFPAAVVERLDSDTITSRTKYESILKNFYDNKIDILIGTQLISKGIDFPNVTLVGVINADIGLLNPDFRATEKTFQILTQVSGRSGRSEKKGEVLIQTSHPDYKVFAFVSKHNYQGYYESEIDLRKKAIYPPFCRFSLIEIRSRDKSFAESKIKEIFNFLTLYDKGKVLTLLSPIQPLFSKLNEYHRFHLLIKSSKEKDPSGRILSHLINSVRNYAEKKFKGDYRLIADVDVVNLL